MSLLRDLLEADIELPKDQYQQTQDDPNAQMNFEHSLQQDLQHLVTELSGIVSKLNNKELVANLNNLYSRVDHLPDEKFPALNYHGTSRSPILTVAGDLNMAIGTIKSLLEDIQTLSKH